MARVEGDVAAECRFRGIMLIAFPRDGAEIVVGVGRVRLQTVRLLEGGRCVVGSLALEQQHAEIEMGGREIGAQPEGAAEQLLRLGVAAGVTQQNGEIVERVDEARLACQRGAIMRLRLRHPRLALADARPYCAAAAVSANSPATAKLAAASSRRSCASSSRARLQCSNPSCGWVPSARRSSASASGNCPR